MLVQLLCSSRPFLVWIQAATAFQQTSLMILAVRTLSTISSCNHYHLDFVYFGIYCSRKSAASVTTAVAARAPNSSRHYASEKKSLRLLPARSLGSIRIRKANESNEITAKGELTWYLAMLQNDLQKASHPGNVHRWRHAKIANPKGPTMPVLHGRMCGSGEPETGRCIRMELP